MSEKQPKLKFEEEKERTATRSPPKKSKVEQSVPKKQKLKQDADKAAEKSQHLRFGKAEITPDEASRMTKQQKRAMYAAAAARSAAHREIDQYGKAGRKDAVEFKVFREVVNKGQDHVAEEQQPFTLTGVSDVGKLMGRNVQLLRQNLPVSVRLIEHINEVRVLKNI